MSIKTRMLYISLVLCIVYPVSYTHSTEQLTDPRFCGVFRYKNGTIKRSTHIISLFKKLYPCPSTGQQTGRCPDWQIDHVIPLACGGCDDIINMQWLPKIIKTAAGKNAKDRWERNLYCGSGTVELSL